MNEYELSNDEVAQIGEIANRAKSYAIAQARSGGVTDEGKLKSIGEAAHKKERKEMTKQFLNAKAEAERKAQGKPPKRIKEKIPSIVGAVKQGTPAYKRYRDSWPAGAKPDDVMSFTVRSEPDGSNREKFAVLRDNTVRPAKDGDKIWTPTEAVGVAAGE